MYVYVVIFMFMLLFCIIAVCALLFRREKAAAGAAAKKKENKTHENNKRNISRAFAIFSFLAARQMRMWKNICVYIACLLYIAFSISVLPVLCFW
jgi:Mg2+/citrate symporter